MLNRRTAMLGGLLAPQATQARATVTKPRHRHKAADHTALWNAENRAGLYVPGWLRIQAAAAAGQAASDDELPQYACFLGEEPEALARESAPAPALALPSLTSLHVEPALDAIVRLSRGRRVVILNEAHNVSRCRAFAHSVALRLREEGFLLLAAEDFPNEPELKEELRIDRPVTFYTGYYARDPVFAEFVRGAKEVGYALAAYEQRIDQQRPGVEGTAGIPIREAAESKNLAEVLEAHADARVLVYCGYNHATKIPQGASAERWMAMRLRDATGIDPLTVNQSFGYPVPDRQRERADVSAVLDRFTPAAPTSLTGADGRPWVIGYPQGSFDVQVVHPRLAPVEGRPGWLAGAPGRRHAPALLPSGLPAGALVQAVRRDEAEKAANVVPSDQYLLATTDVRSASFFLRPGGYVVRIETARGRREVGRLDVT